MKQLQPIPESAEVFDQRLRDDLAFRLHVRSVCLQALEQLDDEEDLDFSLEELARIDNLDRQSVASWNKFARLATKGQVLARLEALKDEQRKIERLLRLIGEADRLPEL